MDHFRHYLLLTVRCGALLLSWYTHCALTAPAPIPRTPQLTGHWVMNWQGTRCPVVFMANGDYGCNWCSVWWYGRYTHTPHPDGSATLTIDEGTNGRGCVWIVELEPGKRSGTLRGGGTFRLEKP